MNKLAIITGASRGIGLAVAHYFAEQGYDLALIAKNNEGLTKAKLAIEEKFNAIEMSIHSMDVSHSHDAYRLMKKIIAQKGHVDVLVNNAGIAIKGGSDIDIDDFETMQAVNVNGLFAIAKAASEAMMQQQSGYIFNLASMAGKRPSGNMGGYCTSKYAVVGFSEALFQELNPYGVKVTALCPSVIDTDMTKSFNIPNDAKIQVADIVTTIDYLLKLSASAVVSSVDIKCKAFEELCIV